MTEYEPKVSEKKRKDIEEIKKLVQEHKVIAIANLENLPAFNYMKIKSQVKDNLTIKYTKKRLMKIAFDELKDEKLKSLKERLEGIPALIFTNEESFKLFQMLRKSKTPAPAKRGDIAPKDIVIPEGPTEFTPGPMIGELGAMGIKTAVENGKITIKSEKLLLSTGDEINSKQAELLSKLNIQPMEIGLNIVLTYENGEIMERAVLDIDTDKMYEDFKTAAGESMALAVHIGYISKDTVGVLLKKAQLEALSLEKEYGSKAAKPVETPKEPKVEEKPQEVAPEPKVGEKPKETKIEEKPTEITPEQTEEVKQPEEPKEEPKVEKKEAQINPEVEKAIEFEIKEDKTPPKIEPKQVEKKPEYDQKQATEEMMKKAQEKLEELTKKKIRGELS